MAIRNRKPSLAIVTWGISALLAAALRGSRKSGLDFLERLQEEVAREWDANPLDSEVTDKVIELIEEWRDELPIQYWQQECRVRIQQSWDQQDRHDQQSARFRRHRSHRGRCGPVPRHLLR